MKHKAYILHLDLLAKIVRQAKHLNLISKKDKNEKALQIAAQFLYDNEPKMLHTLDFIIDCEELYWLTSGKHVTFFDSAATVSAIINSSYSVESVDALYTGPETFMLALPEGTMLGDKEATGGLLVSIMKHGDRAQMLVDNFCKWVNHKTKVDITYDMDDVSEFAVYCSYQQNLGSNEYMRFALPSHSLTEILKFNTQEQYINYINGANKFSFFHGIDLSMPEQAYQYDIVRLIAGLMLYKKALPDRIKAGMPSDFKTQHYSSRYIDGHKPQVIHSPATDASLATNAHYRSWHFRQLMADRFYKGEYESHPRGSRIVFVRDAMVNREIEAETVT